MAYTTGPVVLATASITTGNTGTPDGLISPRSLYTISVSGTFVATIHLQRAVFNGYGGVESYKDIKAYTSATEENGEAAEAQQVRLFCKTGNFTSGTAVLRVSQ